MARATAEAAERGGRLDLEDAHAVRHRLAHHPEFQQALTDLTRRAPAGL
jgi:hypothetical protein